MGSEMCIRDRRERERERSDEKRSWILRFKKIKIKIITLQSKNWCTLNDDDRCELQSYLAS